MGRFEPFLPSAEWDGQGRPPASNHACLHALIFVLLTGIDWELLPACFPTKDVVRQRLPRWAGRPTFRTAWQRFAHDFSLPRDINWDTLAVVTVAPAPVFA